MSWFSTESVNSFAAGIGDQLQSVGDQLQNVQKNLTENNDLLQKLSLTTPELAEERRRIEEEEKRKERIRDSLAGMLPWETRDADRSILVEECKEAILNLSASKETFFGPYQMPETKIKIKEGKEGDGVKEETGDAKAIIDPSPETLENLSKLEPLPPLLDDFDLNAHVGLIQRLLKEDPKLVQMQSKLSGMCVARGDARKLSSFAHRLSETVVLTQRILQVVVLGSMYFGTTTSFIVHLRDTKQACRLTRFGQISRSSRRIPQPTKLRSKRKKKFASTMAPRVLR